MDFPSQIDMLAYGKNGDWAFILEVLRLSPYTHWIGNGVIFYRLRVLCWQFGAFSIISAIKTNILFPMAHIGSQYLLRTVLREKNLDSTGFEPVTFRV